MFRTHCKEMRQEVEELVENDGGIIGQRIAKLREAAGLSIDDLAKALGLSKQGAYAIEDGRNTKKYAQLGEIARILRTTPNDILDFSGPPGDADLAIATFRALLPELGVPPADAEIVCRIVAEALREKAILDVDRRLAARTIAVSQLRKAGVSRGQK